MALGKIDHVDLSVCDLKKAEKYFTEKLGFKLLRYTEPKKSVEVQSPDGDFFFHYIPPIGNPVRFMIWYPKSVLTTLLISPIFI